MSSLSVVYGSLVETQYARDTLRFPVATAVTLDRKPSLANSERRKQLDAIAFATNTRASSVSSHALPRHSSRNVDFFHRARAHDLGNASIESSVVSDAEIAGEAEAPFSPLSMLFEGIIADWKSDSTAPGSAWIEDSPYPYSPVSDIHFRCSASPAAVSLPAVNSRVFSTQLPGASSSSLFSTASTALATPADTRGKGAATILDQALTELIAKNHAPNAISKTNPSLSSALDRESSLLHDACFSSPAPEASWWMRRPSRNLASPCETTHDADVARLTMPGGGPLFEPTTPSHSFSPFWYSPPLLSVSTQATSVDAPNTAKLGGVTVNVTPPVRPPRPQHCSVTLEDFGVYQDGVAISSHVSSPAPSLKSLRKSPAEYLQGYSSRTNSSCTLESHHNQRRNERFKLGPAPAKATRQPATGAAAVLAAVLDAEEMPVVPKPAAGERGSVGSVSTFMSAKSDMSTGSTVSAAPAVSTKIPLHPNLVGQPRTDEGCRLPEPVEPRAAMSIPSPPQLRLTPPAPPPSAHRSAPQQDSIEFPRSHVEVMPSRAPETRMLERIQLRDDGVVSEAAPQVRTRIRGQLHPPSASRSPPRSQRLEVPHAQPAEATEVKRKGSLLRKLSASLRRKRDDKMQPERPTDYGLHRSPSLSSGCGPSPVRAQHDVAEARYQISSPMLIHSSIRTGCQSTTPTDHAPLARYATHVGLPSTAHSPHYTHSRSRSQSTTSPAASSSPQLQPAKSSLKRGKSLAIFSGTAGSKLQRKASTRTIVHSATTAVQPCRKVTFGGVREYAGPPQQASYDSAVSAAEKQEVEVQEKKPFALPKLSMLWGRR